MAPYSFWPAIFVGLSGLYICAARCPSNFKAAWLGFAFSLGYFGFGLSWVGNALLVEDNPYWWVWPIAISGLPFVLSCFTAAFCYIYKRICKQHNNWATYLCFCVCIMAAEYARGHLFTGFPWNLYGYTWISVLPIAQTASLWNIYLLTVITVIWAAFPAYIISTHDKKPIKALLGAFILIGFVSSYMFGLNRLNSSNNDSAALNQTEFVVIQPNIKQSEKWKPEKRSDNFVHIVEQSMYNEASKASKASDKKSYIVIWPETTISQDVLNTKWTMGEIKRMLQSYPAPAFLVTGALRYVPESKSFYNSLLVLNSDAEIIGTYDKSHLVPFGEYMPLSNIIDIAPIVGFSGFEIGMRPNIIDIPNGINIGALICYEIIFPKFTQFSANNKPDILINVTNDAWYGVSAGPYQHLVQTQFRAIESGLPVIRAANTGVSAIITPQGVISSRMPLNKHGVIQTLDRSD